MPSSTVFFQLLLLLIVVLLTRPGITSESGYLLYQQYCAACHGSNGDGGVGMPLSRAGFQSSTSNEYLRKTIRFGRPGRIMPAFPQLSDNEIQSIIAFIRTFHQAKIPAETSTKIIGNHTTGKKLFSRYCASCHGANATGQAGTGVTFSRPRNHQVMPPALNNDGFLASASDHFIKQIITNGRPGTAMRSFKKQGLSESQINDLVSYIRHFANTKKTTEQADLKPAIQYESSYSVAETVASIQRAAIGKNFRIIRTQTLNNGFVDKDNENPQQTIIYFCNFDFMNKALAVDPRAGLFLPCRITVVKQKNKVFVLAINPLRLSKLFNNSELDRLCKKMRNTYIDIIEEAIL